MAIIYVYSEKNDTIERFERGLNESMPYVKGGTLAVRDFRGKSCSTTFWTTRCAMEAWGITAASFGKKVPVDTAFRRIWEQGFAPQSQHYAGVAFEAGNLFGRAKCRALRDHAERLDIWSYIEPEPAEADTVYLDRRYGSPACKDGYPTIKQGCKGVYVFVLQDALNVLGYGANVLDGKFASGTSKAVSHFQEENGLPATGIVNCETWEAITMKAVGRGQTPTVLCRCKEEDMEDREPTPRFSDMSAPEEVPALQEPEVIPYDDAPPFPSFVDIILDSSMEPRFLSPDEQDGERLYDLLLEPVEEKGSAE